jgi:hypothetical protein
MYFHKKSRIPTRKPRNKKSYKKTDNERQNTPFPKPHVAKVSRKPVLGIRDILVRIRIPGFVPLTNGSGSGYGSNSGSDSFLH